MSVLQHAGREKPVTRSPRTWNRPVIVLATVASAVLINQVLYAIGVSLGGSFDFSRDGLTIHVDPVTVFGFTVVPLTLGMTAAALLSLKWPRLVTLALYVGPAIALGSIMFMTVPAGFDPISAVTLGSLHVTLVPIMVAGLLAVRARARVRSSTTSS